ncbi:Gfo/Idh/MocA family oxidoreductase [bacterium]|nr:Gfo/Idh/MocA family oxidoreductase [bacterium]
MPLRVAVVGLGHNGDAWVRAYESCEQTQVVALCDLCPDRLEAALALAPQARGFSNLDELLDRERPEVLSVHTPDHLHADPFVKGLEAGCHVLVEKPMGNTIEDLDRMTEAARSSDRKTQVGHILRFNPLFAEVKQQCAQGALGELFYLEADYIHNLLVQAGPARTNPQLGNMNWYLEKEIPIVGGGAHQLDLLRWFADSDVESVCGFGNSIAFPAMRNPDCMAALFQFASGAVGKVSALYGPVGDRPPHGNLAIYGTKGTFRAGKLMLGEGHDVAVTDLGHLEMQGHPYDPQLHSFVESILEDKPTRSDAFSGANSAAATIMAAEAIAAGKVLRVPNYRP